MDDNPAAKKASNSDKLLTAGLKTKRNEPQETHAEGGWGVFLHNEIFVSTT